MENENKVTPQETVVEQKNAAPAKKLDYEKQFLDAVDNVANGFIGFIGAVFNRTVEKLSDDGAIRDKLVDKISDGLSKPINDAVKLVTDELDK
jgi:hypothetical protein